MSAAKREQLLKEIEELKAKLRDREAALPAHSVRPHQVQEIEELEEQIAGLEKMLGEITS
jgi:chromosome segregation ATPase